MTLPASITTGRVRGRFLIGITDREEDTDEDPDVIPARGFVTFTASVPYLPSNGGDPVTVVTSSIRGVLDADGYLCTPSSADPKLPRFRGVRLIATDNDLLPVQGWTWTVSYALTNPDGTSLGGIIPSHPLAVLTGSDQDLTLSMRVPASQPLGVTQAEALVIEARNEVNRISDMFDGVAGGSIEAADITDSTATGRQILKALDAAAARAAIGAGTSNLALGTTSTTAKAGNYAPTWNEVTSKPTTFTPAPHTSASVTDFAEAAQDAVAALLVEGTGIGLSYSDSTGELTVTGTAGQTLDAEAVRDAIGVALIGLGNISVTVNDPGDTITLVTTATVNSTDAALRDRTTHTGEQAQSTVTGLVTALAGKASTTHTHAISSVTNLQGSLDAKSAKVNTDFIVRWDGTSWYALDTAGASVVVTSIANLQTLGFLSAQVIKFVGHPDGTMPSWARELDHSTVG